MGGLRWKTMCRLTEKKCKSLENHRIDCSLVSNMHWIHKAWKLKFWFDSQFLISLHTVRSHGTFTWQKKELDRNRKTRLRQANWNQRHTKKDKAYIRKFYFSQLTSFIYLTFMQLLPADILTVDTELRHFLYIQPLMHTT